jgi:hypothetical protein
VTISGAPAAHLCYECPVDGQLSRYVARDRRQRRRLLRWALLSIGGHAVALAVLIPLLEREPEVETHVVTEVDLVDLPGPRQIAKQPTRQPRTERRGKRHRARKKRVVRAARPAPQQPEPDEELSELLIMREPPAQDPTPTPPPPVKDRFAAFRTRAPRRGPTVAGQERLAGVAVTRYSDGGKVLRSTGGPPDRAKMGLLDLAAGQLRRGAGSQACNPYRGWRGANRRELILIVDTSGSVVQNRRAPASLVCAAGAALAALKRGFPVTVINFSSITQRYGPTERIDVVYKALSSFQAQGTVLPRLSSLGLKAGGPRDYVLISDAAIKNLKEIIPSYGKALRADPRSRAILYYLGASQHQEIDPAEALKLIRSSGFSAEQV